MTFSSRRGSSGATPGAPCAPAPTAIRHSPASAACRPLTATSRTGRAAASEPTLQVRRWRPPLPSPAISSTCATWRPRRPDMEPFRSVTGPAAPLLMDDINTDQIIPSAWLRRMDADLGEGLFAYLRRRPDGNPNADFVLEQPQFREARI